MIEVLYYLAMGLVRWSPLLLLITVEWVVCIRWGNRGLAWCLVANIALGALLMVLSDRRQPVLDRLGVGAGIGMFLTVLAICPSIAFWRPRRPQRPSDLPQGPRP